MRSVRAILVMAHLTLHEALRRRVLLAVLIGGAAFLVLYGTGFHFVEREVHRQVGAINRVQYRITLNFFLLAGLYAVNFLTVMTSVLLPVDTLSGEIASGVIQTLAAKPIRRVEIVLGKWLAYVGVSAGYLLLMAGGVLAIGRVLSGLTPPDVAIGLPLMMLEGALLVTLSISCGARLTTITSGITVFGLFGLAFVGGWVEQIGTMTGNDAARNVGTVASLIMPSESLWQLAAHHMQPAIMSELHLSPFSPASVPSPEMVVWAAGYLVVALAWGLRGFQKRAL
jgi:ABC-type transport system involved in multi-copper enzyme maturation permease subunit